MVTPGCLKGWGNEWRVCSLVLPTPSLLSLVHNSLHSQLLATVFLFLPVVHTRGHFDCTPQHFSHSPAHLLLPYRHTNVHENKTTNKKCARTLHRDTHSLNYPVWHTNHKAASFFFPLYYLRQQKQTERTSRGISVAAISCHLLLQSQRGISQR